MRPIQHQRHQRPSPARSRRMTLATLALAVSGVAAGVLTPATAAAQNSSSREEFRWQGQVQPGQTVEIRGVNGGIDAEPSGSGQIEVNAIKTAGRSDVREVRIVVVPHAEGVTICAVYPNVDGEEPNECRAGGGRNSTRDNDVKVQFSVRVPAGVTFKGNTVNGGIAARDLDGRVSLNTVNGNVEISTSSYASVKTVNGSITARLGRADWQDVLEMKTVNGSITLHLPGSVATDVNAKTVSGQILSDFPIAIREAGRRSLKGTIGSGGGRGLALETVNGTITLKSGD
jgi:putative adhesin